MYGYSPYRLPDLLNQMCDDIPDTVPDASSRPNSVTQCYFCGAKEKFGDGKTRSPSLKNRHIYGCPERDG